MQARWRVLVCGPAVCWLSQPPRRLFPAGRGDRPHPRGLVIRGGDDAASVRAEGCVPHTTLMAGERGQQLAALRIPQPCGLVQRSGDDAPSIRAELCAPRSIFMAGERGEELAAL